MEVSSSQRLEAMLGKGETVAWTGRPAQGIQFRAVDALLIPTSIVFICFALVWETLAVRSGAPFFPLFGIPFVLVGLYFTVGRFLFDAYLRAHTTYAITDRAAYVITDGFLAKTRTYSPASLSPLELTIATDGTGTVHFGPHATFGGLGASGFSIWMPDRSQFFRIANAADVYGLLHDLQNGAQSPPASHSD